MEKRHRENKARDGEMAVSKFSNKQEELFDIQHPCKSGAHACNPALGRGPQGYPCTLLPVSLTKSTRSGLSKIPRLKRQGGT